MSIEQKTTLLDELRKNDAGAADRWAYRYAIWILGGTGILAIAGLVFLSWYGGTISDGLIAIGSAAVGGLAGLLAPSPMRASAS
jgi:hypothetical protein